MDLPVYRGVYIVRIGKTLHNLYAVSKVASVLRRIAWLIGTSSFESDLNVLVLQGALSRFNFAKSSVHGLIFREPAQ
jgi:hypothetical protein